MERIMAAPIGLVDLPDEIILNILFHLDQGLEIISVDRREWLSVESLTAPPPSSPSDLVAVGNLRRVCKKFSGIVAQHQFRELTVRFSLRGLERLEAIAGRPLIAQYVKKFSYLVPRFLPEDRNKVSEYFRITDPDSIEPKLHEMVRRSREQYDIVNSGRDVSAVNTAIRAFSKLHHIRLRRLQDELESDFCVHLSNHSQEANRLVQLDWTLACVHASKTIGRAMLLSGSFTPYISGLNFNAPSAAKLLADRTLDSASISSHLECVSLRFEHSSDFMDLRPSLIAGLRHIFMSSNKMEALHVGFPTCPVSLPPLQIFGGARMEKLKVFSIDSWRVTGDEIIESLKLHRASIRGVRLRGVLLENGSRWSDVLEFLRNEMPQLQWVSLRRINYEEHFDEIAARGRDVTDDYNNDSDSDIEDEFDANTGTDSDEGSDTEVESMHDDYDDDGYDSDSVDGTGSVADSTIGSDPGIETIPEGHGFDRQLSGLESFCMCPYALETMPGNYLGDNGESVTRSQWKVWERWVITGVCPIHDINV